jgi:hypothetical protein
LCCLGLPPESAMISITPLLHEIIPYGWSRVGFLAPDATITGGWSEHPEAPELYRERSPPFLNDPSSPGSLVFGPAARAAGIGWALPLQGRGYLESAWYRDMEAPLDACWVLDAAIGDRGNATASLHLTRPRTARPFTVDDVQRLDRLRPWLAHAFRRCNSCNAHQDDEAPINTTGPPVRSGQLILTADAKLVFQTPGIEQRLRILLGEPVNYKRYVPVSDRLPAPVLKLLRQITGGANGTSNTPPRMRISTAYGVLTLEAKWLVPAGTLPEDAARDPKSCLISVTIELHEHPIAHAARMLRESGATPAQTKVGIQFAFGKTKPAIADELGIQLSSVVDVAKKLYQNLDVHNSAELSTIIWLGQRQDSRKGTDGPRSG